MHAGVLRDLAHREVREAVLRRGRERCIEDRLRDRLVARAPGGGRAFRGRYAASWSISADNKALTLKLRKDVDFLDGAHFNAAAVITNFHYTKDKNGALTSVLTGKVASFSAGRVRGDDQLQGWTVRTGR